MSDPIFYLSELEFAPEAVAPFMHWYAWRHAPDIFKAGFETCASYVRLEGAPAVVDVYQGPTWDLFLGAGYQARAKDPYSREILKARLGGPNTIYGYTAYAGPAGSSELTKIDCDWMSLLRFDADDPAERAVVAWLPEELRRLTPAGARTLRLVHRTKDHPTLAPSTRPRLALFAEWDQPPLPPADLLAAIGRVLGRDLAPDAGFTGLRAYPWPDHAPARLGWTANA
jgi:hypothetical protein